VRGEKNRKQVVVGNERRVEFYARGLGMPGIAGRHLLVRRVRDIPAGVSRTGLHNAAQILEDGLGAPKTSAAKNGDRRFAVVSDGIGLRVYFCLHMLIKVILLS
jgi:hypothetical protein